MIGRQATGHDDGATPARRADGCGIARIGAIRPYFFNKCDRPVGKAPVHQGQEGFQAGEEFSCTCHLHDASVKMSE